MREGGFEEGFFLQPPFFKTARAFQLSRAPELDVVIPPAGFVHPVTVLQPSLTLPAGYPPAAAKRAVADVAHQFLTDYVRRRPFVLWINSITHFQALLAEQLMPPAKYRVFDSGNLLMMYQRSGGEPARQSSGILKGSDLAICGNAQSMALVDHPKKYLIPDCGEATTLRSGYAELDLPPLFPKPPGAVYIGFTGMLTEERTDCDLLHAVLERFPAYQFIFAGHSNRSSLIAKLKSHPNFHYIPEAQDDVLRAIIHQCDVAIVPEIGIDSSRCEDGSRILDYLASDVPVLSSSYSSKAKFGDAIHIAPSIWEFSFQLERLVSTPRQEVRTDGLLLSGPERWKLGEVPIASFFRKIQ